jgi:hypothetical protein
MRRAEKLRFLEAIEYPKSNDPNEKIYEEWGKWFTF